MRFDRNDPDAGNSVLAFTGQTLSSDAAYADFGLPVCGSDGAVAFRTVVKVTSGSGSRKVHGVVLDGDFYSTPEGAPYSIVPTSEAVVGLPDRGAMLANLIGGTPRKIPAVVSISEDGLEAIVSVGEEAPGTGGAKFQRFAQLGMLPDRGIFFTALLAQKKGVVSSKNRNGLWAQDSNGKLILVLRTGQPLTVDGAKEQVQSFLLLPPGSGAGYQALANDGNLVCLVKFKGELQRVMQFRVS